LKQETKMNTARIYIELLRIHFSENFNSQYLLTIKKGDIMSTPYNDDDREWTDEEKTESYLEELEDLEWDWDAWDPSD